MLCWRFKEAQQGKGFKEMPFLYLTSHSINQSVSISNGQHNQRITELSLQEDYAIINWRK